MDPLELKAYGHDDFKYQAPEVLATVGDDLPDILGTSRDIVPKGFSKYEEYFDKDDYEDEQKQVLIPRYDGPKNTRVNIVTEEDNTFQINGMINHAQASCVYLKQHISARFFADVTVDEIAAGYINLRYRDQIRPFSIQRQFKQLEWSSPQVFGDYETNIQQHVKLAPYLCDRAVLHSHVVNKKIIDSQDAGGGTHTITIGYDLYEPLLGFQSGYAVLKAARPFNQQNMVYPLAIQDYKLKLTKFDKRDAVKRTLRDGRFTIDNYGDDMYTSIVAAADIGHEEAANHRIQEVTFGELELVTFSQDDAIQSNKSVSSVLLHAPVFQVFKQSYALDISVFGINYAVLHQVGQTFPVILGRNQAGASPDNLKIKCNTSKGLPSYLMIYLEDFGTAYVDDSAGNRFEENPGIGTDLLIGSHPRIQQLTINIFNQAVPVTKQMTGEELEYLTRKNSHPNCDFQKEISYDPIVLLRLEDLGLGTELKGYPNMKRLELEIEINQLLLPYKTQFLNVDKDITAYACFIYENHVLEGNNDRMEFVWKS